METNNQFAQNTIFTANSELLHKKRCGKSVTYSFIIILLGIAIVSTTMALMDDKSSSLYTALMTIGITGVVIGLIKIIFSDNKMVYIPTESPAKKLSVYFKPDDIISIQRAFDDQEYDKLVNYAADNRTSGVRLDLAISKDHKFATCQLFKFIPYHYQAASQVYNVSLDKISAFDAAVKAVNAKQ